jgi:hypothetical protein
VAHHHPGSNTSSCIVPLASFPYNCCVALHMLEPTPDAFNWPERPSSSDSAAGVKLEQAPDSKAFYVPSSTTPTFASKPQPIASAPPPIRRHSSSGAVLRRSKQPYSTSPHEARIRNKYTNEAAKMSSANYPQHWVKAEGGGCCIIFSGGQVLMLCPRC